MTNYEKIEFGAGDSIDSAIKRLQPFKESGKLVYGEFNGKKLYSDIDDIDSAYKKITGKTKLEFDEERKIEHDKYVEDQNNHKNAIPELTKEWIEKGNTILGEKYREYWAEIVPIRLSDLYQGMELGCCLDIVVELNNGCTLDKAKDIIVNQDHSGMSYSLVCSMVKAFCDRGSEFASYVR